MSGGHISVHQRQKGEHIFLRLKRLGDAYSLPDGVDEDRCSEITSEQVFTIQSDYLDSVKLVAD